MSVTDDLVSKIIEEFHRKVPFDPQKRNIVARIIRETPEDVPKRKSYRFFYVRSLTENIKKI